MSYYGMDTAQGEDFASLLADRRKDMSEQMDALSSRISSIDSYWQGPDAEDFRSRWDSLRSGTIDPSLDRLMDFAREIADQAQDQDVVSAADALSAIGERFRDIFRIDDDWSWKNLLPAPNDWEDWLGMGIAGVLDGLDGAYSGLAKALSNPKLLQAAFIAGGDDLMNGLRGAAGAASKVSKVLGPIGAVVSGGFAAWDRWEQDSQDPSLSTGERVGRALIDGVANGGGGFLGGMGGAALGASIGTFICPGVGTVIGGAIGGIVGGLGGSSIANGAVDWLLG